MADTEYPSAERLMAQLDGARMVRYDPERSSVFAWHGGHGVHVYEADGSESYYFSVGNFSANDAAADEVAEAIALHMSAQEWPPDDEACELASEHRAGEHAGAYVVDCLICRQQEADFDPYRPVQQVRS